MKLNLFVFIFVLSLDAFAEDVFTFEKVVLKGTGCPQGTTSTIMSPDQQSISILFDRFLVEVPQTNGNNDNELAPIENGRRIQRMDRQMDHKVCRMEITASIPSGQKVESLETSIDLRGSVDLEEGTRGSFRSEVLKWEGIRGRADNGRAIDAKTWTGPCTDNWLVSKVQNLEIKSNCARRDFRQDEKKIVFVLQNVLVTRSIGRNKDASAMLMVDSTDLNGSLKLRIKTAPCDDDIRPGPGPIPRPSPRPRLVHNKSVVSEGVNLSPDLDKSEDEMTF